MPKKIKSKHCWSDDMAQHAKCKFGMCQCPCHSQAYKDRKSAQLSTKQKGIDCDG